MKNLCEICLWNKAGNCTSHGLKTPIISELFAEGEECGSFDPKYSIVAEDSEGNELLLPLTSI